MSRYSYVNGKYVPHKYAHVHIEDRGFQFADGVYEVIAYIEGRFADEKGHLDRLERSLSELSLTMPVSRQILQILIREVLRKNKLKNAAIYIQITRGVAKRNFKFPSDSTKPSLVIITWPFDFQNNPDITKGIEVISVPDQRWARRDIKTIALLPQVLANQKAASQNKKEAWMLNNEGFVTEGSSSNAWIVKNKTLQTHPATQNILKGVTRTALEKIAADLSYSLIEKPFTLEHAYEADECFKTSATGLISPIVKVNDIVIGEGKPGKITKLIYEEYLEYVQGLKGDAINWSA